MQINRKGAQRHYLHGCKVLGARSPRWVSFCLVCAGLASAEAAQSLCEFGLGGLAHCGHVTTPSPKLFCPLSWTSSPFILIWSPLFKVMASASLAPCTALFAHGGGEWPLSRILNCDTKMFLWTQHNSKLSKGVVAAPIAGITGRDSGLRTAR